MNSLDSPIKVAVAGAGKISRHHLMALRQCRDAQVVGISNRGNPRIHKLKDEFQIPAAFSDFDEMIDKTDPDAVFILVSHDHIFEVAKSCLRRGIHALIEKPPGKDSKEVRELSEIAKSSGSKVMVGFNRRHIGAWKKALSTVLAHGPLVGIDVECSEDARRLISEGIHSREDIRERLITNSIHMIDLMQAAGGSIEEVHPIQFEAGGYPGFHASVKFRSGAMGSFRAYWASVPQNVIKLYGCGISAELRDNLALGKISHRSGQQISVPIEHEDQIVKPGFLAQTRAFLQMLLNEDKDAPLGASLKSALISIELAERIGALKR